MNQTEVYVCPLPLEPPSHLPPQPTPLVCLRALELNSLNHTENLHWLSNFTYGNVYISMLLSQYIPPSPSPGVSITLFSNSEFCSFLSWVFKYEFYEWFVYFGLTNDQVYHLQTFFLPLGGLSLQFVDGFLCCAKAFKYNYVSLVYFCFCFPCLKRDPKKKKYCYNLYQSVLLIFSSSFMISGLTFRSLIHFKFIFAYCMRKCCNLILLHVSVQFSEHHILKSLSFPHCIFLSLLS